MAYIKLRESHKNELFFFSYFFYWILLLAYDDDKEEIGMAMEITGGKCETANCTAISTKY